MHASYTEGLLDVNNCAFAIVLPTLHSPHSAQKSLHRHELQSNKATLCAQYN